MAARPTLIRLALALLLGLLALLLWPRPAAPDAASARRLLADGILHIGMDTSYPPFASWQDEALQGFDVELGRALAEAMGVEAAFVPISFDGLYDALKTGQVDILISALVYNPARTAEVAYTRPYFDNGLLLVSPQARPLSQMNAIVGLRLAYQYGSDADTEARKWARRIADFETRPYEYATHALDALCLGQADAALVDATTYFLYQRQHRADCPSQAVHATQTPYVIATRLSEAALRDALDALLGQMQESGHLDRLRAAWL